MLYNNIIKNSISNYYSLSIIILLIILGTITSLYYQSKEENKLEYLKGYKQGANDMKQSLKEDLFYLEYMQEQLEKQK